MQFLCDICSISRGYQELVPEKENLLVCTCKLAVKSQALIAQKQIEFPSSPSLGYTAAATI
jgi:hypothetical protein